MSPEIQEILVNVHTTQTKPPNWYPYQAGDLKERRQAIKDDGMHAPWTKSLFQSQVFKHAPELARCLAFLFRHPAFSIHRRLSTEIKMPPEGQVEITIIGHDLGNEKGKGICRRPLESDMSFSGLSGIKVGALVTGSGLVSLELLLLSVP